MIDEDNDIVVFRHDSVEEKHEDDTKSEISSVGSTTTFHSVEDEDGYQSLLPSPRSPLTQLPMPVHDEHIREEANPDSDLLSRFKNTYRVLDLVSEQGNGGLVEKIVIDQVSIAKFMNDVCPGAYVSLSKVDFKSLDNLEMKVKGIYGSKEKIVELLTRVKAVDDKLATDLLRSSDNTPGAKLRSGLYLVRTASIADAEQVLALYWPEDKTWNDTAISSIRRNRVTFIRYLTKVTDHVVCLISSEEAQSLSWNDGDNPTLGHEMESDEYDPRMFDFEVSETSEQEETVIARPGFEISTENAHKHNVPLQFAHDNHFLLERRLVQGATHQALLTARYAQRSEMQRRLSNEINPVHLKSLLNDKHIIHLDEGLQRDQINILIECGIDKGSLHCQEWKRDLETLHASYDNTLRDGMIETDEKLNTGKPATEAFIQAAIERRARHNFPMFPLSETFLPSETQLSHFDNMVKLHPSFFVEFEHAMLGEEKTMFASPTYSDMVNQYVLAKAILDLNPAMDARTLEDAVKSRLYTDTPKQGSSSVLNFSPRALYSYIVRSNPPTDPVMSAYKDLTKKSNDQGFILGLIKDSLATHSLLRHYAESVANITRDWMVKKMPKLVNRLVRKAQAMQRESAIKHQVLQAADAYASGLDESRRRFLSHYSLSSMTYDELRSILFIRSIDIARRGRTSQTQQTLSMTAELQTPLPPAIEYILQPLQLSTHDSQELQMNARRSFLPILDRRLARTFLLPLDTFVMYLHLMENGRVLLIVQRKNSLLIYSEDASNLGHATSKAGYKKALNLERLGNNILISYNENTRTLALCASTDLQLHLFQFDETLESLDNFGHVDLRSWYDDPKTTIAKMCIFPGSGHEDIVLVDSSGIVRMFSLALQQFRQTYLTLSDIPSCIFPTPDESCLMLIFHGSHGSTVRAYHRASFGTTEGINLELPHIPADSLSLTSFGSRSNVHLIQLDNARAICTSTAFEIFKKEREFQFEQHGLNQGRKTTAVKTAHNCLLDVHSDVWTRFPVIAAVSRRCMMSHLTFGSDRHFNRYRPYFDEMEHEFELRTHKPTGNKLRDMNIEGVECEILLDMLSSSTWTGSSVLIGSWTVDVLCLIPLHIAVAQDNRFIPLKDGLTSAEMQQSLLGAEVGGIVDVLSFGWYESIFASYMSRRPVKVVSSMGRFHLPQIITSGVNHFQGEQSVGKSYMLNHLVDSSFAGSAMRTTEGVWMSVTPTEDSLIVALDFEGVHSVERTAQEDTLLVLFNCAISNLVLFRNNFAMSRDITDLFQSFQSSSGILDRDANPSLFRSLLVIVIKDVVETDTDEIAREFGLQFQRIVRDEQGNNFISRLHGKKLKIIPWPVIESRQFYSMFNRLRQTLETQKVTHERAGEFLLTLKVLMAKLMANDWSSMSQTMIAHRTHRLLRSLDIAIATGYTELDPEEPLKNLDTSEVIVAEDTSCV